MKKSLLVVSAISAAGIAGLFGASTYADTSSTTNDGGPMSGLVQALSSKFNLDKSEVQAVFDEQRSKMEAEREQKVADEITSLVQSGKLTQEQAD